MKLFLGILHACAVMAFVEGGVRLARSDTDGETGHEPQTCLFTDAADGQSHHSRLVNAAINCAEDVEGAERVSSITTLEEFRKFFKSYCAEQPRVNTCLDLVLDTSTRCVNDTQQQVLQILVGLMRSVLNTGCTDDGELLARFADGIQNEAGEENPLNVCIDFGKLKGENDDYSSKMILLYNSLDLMKTCLVDKVHDSDENNKNAVRTILDAVKNELKCIHPEDHTLVLCSTITQD